MNLKLFYTRSCLTFLLIFGGNYVAGVDGKPTITFLDGYLDTVDRDYIIPYQQPITDYHLSRLRRGYYYVEDGYITAVPESVISANRRVDAVAASVDDTTAIAGNYRRTHGKRKKLFVPNLFG